MYNSLICGLDEAGRGPVLGPMVLAGVCFEQSNLSCLSEMGVKDSKKLSAEKRIELAALLKNQCVSFKTIELTPREIDNRESKRLSLNQLEVMKFIEIINELKPDIIYIDAADTDEQRFGKTIKKKLDYAPKKIISKHRADDLFPIVGAASILAKTQRDDIIEQLKQKYGELGSGYPSDEITIRFLRNWIRNKKRPPPFARTSWKTTKRILDKEINNRKITQYF